MLYGYKFTLDGQNVTIVSAGDTVAEYETWVSKIPNSSRHWDMHIEPEFLDLMTNPDFKGFKIAPQIFFHDEKRQEKFFDKEKIKEVQSMAARDMQNQMIYLDSEEAEAERIEKEKQYAEAMGEEYKEKTLAEIHGLEDKDPWSTGTEVDVNAKPTAFKDEMSDASFGGAAQIKKNREAGNTDENEKLALDRITAKWNEDGTLEMGDVLGHKRTKAKEEKDEKEFSLFDDDDLKGWKVEPDFKEEDMAKIKIECNHETDVSKLPDDIRIAVLGIDPNIEKVEVGFLPKEDRVNGKIVIPDGFEKTALTQKIVKTNDLKEEDKVSFATQSATIFEVDGNDPFIIFKAAYSYKVLRIQK